VASRHTAGQRRERAYRQAGQSATLAVPTGEEREDLDGFGQRLEDCLDQDAGPLAGGVANGNARPMPAAGRCRKSTDSYPLTALILHE
jgi:hypothetical protein